jgi:hypothetical protein
MELTVSRRTLNILAGVVWIVGGVALLLKGGSLLLEASALRPAHNWPVFVIGLALFLGGVKARFLFSRSCHKNLTRIAALAKPKFWQFFKPSFFFFLVLMILAGALSSRLAHGNYLLLCAVAALDLTIAVALFGSCYVFWQQKAFLDSTS